MKKKDQNKTVTVLSNGQSTPNIYLTNKRQVLT